MSRLTNHFTPSLHKVGKTYAEKIKDVRAALEKAQRDAVVEKTVISNRQATGVDARRRAELVAEDAARFANSDDDRRPVEVGGPKGLEPTRYGDWEKAGRCIDF